MKRAGLWEYCSKTESMGQGVTREALHLALEPDGLQGTLGKLIKLSSVLFFKMCNTGNCLQNT